MVCKWAAVYYCFIHLFAVGPIRSGALSRSRSHLTQHRIISPTANPADDNAGTYNLGGIFSAHTGYIANDTAVQCTDYSLKDLLRAHAMMYAVRNANANILPPGVQLAYSLADDCNSIDEAVKAGMTFMMGDNPVKRQGWINRYKKTILQNNDITCDPKTDSLCTTESSRKTNTSKQTRGNNNNSPMLAVIGGASSDISSAVSSLLSVNTIPQISYGSTSPQLSDNSRYPSFFRTVPSDNQQVQAITDLLNHYNWRWISTLATNDEYGKSGLQALKTALHNTNNNNLFDSERSICVAKEELLDPFASTVIDIDDTLLDLEKPPAANAKAVILISNSIYVDRFMEDAVLSNLTGKTWIASESWGTKILQPSYESVIKGALGLVIDSDYPYEFYYDFMNASVEDAFDLNPWLADYFKSTVNLTVTNTSTLIMADIWPLLPDNEGQQGPFSAVDMSVFTYVPQVIDAVNVVAYAIQNLYKNETMKDLILGGKLTPLMILDQLKTQKGFPRCCGSGQNFSFSSTGDIPGGYWITNAQMKDGQLQFLKVGHWDGRQSPANLTINESQVVWPLGRGQPTVSVCMSTCGPGTYTVMASTPCCWSCPVCPKDYYNNETGLSECYACPDGMTNNSDSTACIYLEDFVSWNSAGEVVALSIAGLGILMVVITFVLLFHYRRTMVVVCSNRPLTFVMLGCLGAAFVLPFIYALRPHRWTCIFETLVFGAVFSTIIAILLVKTWHVRQIFTAKLSRTLHLTSQKGMQRRELWLTAAVTVVYFAVTVPYFGLSPPTPVAHAQDCGPNWRNVQVMSTCYIGVLSLVATYMGFKARKLPENYNESKYICTTMLLLILVWLGTFPSYFRLSDTARALILSISVDAAAAIVLILMFAPKLYIIYFEPYKNTPAYVKATNMKHVWKQHSKDEMRRRVNRAPNGTNSELNRQLFGNADQNRDGIVAGLEPDNPAVTLRLYKLHDKF